MILNADISFPALPVFVILKVYEFSGRNVEKLVVDIEYFPAYPGLITASFVLYPITPAFDANVPVIPASAITG